MEETIRAAQPSLDRLFRAVGSLGTCVVLTDRAGVPVERRGHPGEDPGFEAAGLWTGTRGRSARRGPMGLAPVSRKGGR